MTKNFLSQCSKVFENRSRSPISCERFSGSK